MIDPTASLTDELLRLTDEQLGSVLLALANERGGIENLLDLYDQAGHLVVNADE